MDLSFLTTLMWAAAGLLFCGGVAKIRTPVDPIPALRAVGLPAHRRLVIALGVAEVSLATACLLVSSPIPLILMGLLYIAFAAFIAALAAKHAPGLSCGCAGGRYIPPSYVHTVLNLLAATATLLVAFSPPPSLVDLVDRIGGLGLIGVAFGTGGMAWAAYLVVAYVPTLFTSYKEAA